MSTVFILSWDCLGLESVINATQIDQDYMWEVLTTTNQDQVNFRSNKLGEIFRMLTLRARYNSHRHYEIYSIEVDDGISEDDLREMFEDNPQASADLIRKRGRKLYSDRLDTAGAKIL